MRDKKSKGGIRAASAKIATCAQGFSWLIAAGFLLVIADQLSKYLVRRLLPESYTVPVIKGFLYFTSVRNTGAAFGSLQNTNSILIWATLIAVGLIMYLWEQFPKGRLSRVCLMLILAGTLGNLIDRVFLGYVTDFADIRVWPVFNLADSMVTVGITCLMALMIKEGISSGKGKARNVHGMRGR